MIRVVGTDPGTSSLDLLLMVDGAVADQARLEPSALRADPGLLVRTLQGWKPLDLVAGPSGYGVPLVTGDRLTERDIDQMAFVRDAERGQDVGVLGFRSQIRSLLNAEVPVVFLPGGIDLPTIPRASPAQRDRHGHRRQGGRRRPGTDEGTAPVEANRSHRSTFAVVEVGTAFTAILVVQGGKIVDASAGTRGPIGLRSGGAWDGEVAYAVGPLSKGDLFRGGVADLGPEGLDAFRESLRKHVAGLRSVTRFDRVYLSGSGLDRPEIAESVSRALDGLGDATPLPSLPGAWVKHASQGAALIADGLAGGCNADLIESLELRHASGTIGDMIRPCRGDPASSA